MPKRDNADAASAPKRQKTMPAMQASKHVSDAPGWCSDPTKKMSAEVIAALDRKCGAHVRSRGLKESDLRQYHASPLGRRGDHYFDATLLEGGSGDRTLYQVAEFHEDVQDRHAADLASREAFAASSLDDFRDDCRDVAKKIWMIEDAEAYMTKYGYANHGKRLEAMHAAMKVFDECTACPGFDNGAFCDAAHNMTTVLLLGHNQPICRSNAIPALTKAGIVIQRREAPGAGEE